MNDFYSIHEYVKFHKKKIETIDDAKNLYDRYVYIVKLRFKEDQIEDRKFFLDEADRWLEIEQYKENVRLWELHYKDDYYADEYDDLEYKYELDN